MEARPPFALLGLSPSLPSPSFRHSQVHQALSHGWALLHAVPCSLLQSLSDVEVNIVSAVKPCSPPPPHTHSPEPPLQPATAGCSCGLLCVYSLWNGDSWELGCLSPFSPGGGRPPWIQPSLSPIYSYQYSEQLLPEDSRE